MKSYCQEDTLCKRVIRDLYKASNIFSNKQYIVIKLQKNEKNPQNRVITYRSPHIKKYICNMLDKERDIGRIWFK